MRVRLIAAGVVLAFAAAGCGGGGPSTRDEVSSYIDAVNAIQAKAKQPSQLVSEAGRILAKPKSDRAAAERKLQTAALKIDALRLKVAAVKAPPEARRMRTLLLELMRGEAEIAREVAAFITFGPAFQEALTPLGPAGTRLRDALAVNGPVEAKAAALDAYAAQLDAALERLRTIHPPAVSRPQYAAQVRTLERVHSATVALAKAVRAKQSAALPPLLRRFQEAAIGNQSLRAQRAQIAAVRAYNARVRRLDELRRKLAVERARLDRVID